MAKRVTRLPLLMIEHNERGSASVSSHDHLRLELVKQNRDGGIEQVFVVNVEPDAKLHVIARPNPEPQESTQ